MASSATDGRLTSISNPQLSNVSFAYGYVTGSSLVGTVTGPAHTVTNTWEPNRNVLDLKENEVGTTNISSYDYSVNSLGQRTNVAKTGTAFGSARDIAWGYDALGQVTSADSTIPGLDRGYRYDTIGNRLKSADGTTDPDDPSATGYVANALNQYSGIGSLTPSYDDDGNATAYPLPANVSANSTLVWDGENRLIEAQVSGVGTVTYLYDAQSRRIAETVGSATKITIYDGWNPIAEYGASYALTKANTWGMDLSGSMQGAGGVGGLLSVTDGTGTHFPTFDGNGNVSEYLDGIGTVVAHYEYDPFGKTTVATGSKAQDFAHRFSTKPLDATTGLYYYGYRWYGPLTGRWPSRDPIEEEGGVNLYGFVDNDSVNYVDILGLALVRECYSDVWSGHAGDPANNKKKQWERDRGPCDILNLVSCYGNFDGRPIWPSRRARDHQNTDRDRARGRQQGLPTDSLLVDQLFSRIKVAERLAPAQCSDPKKCCDAVTIRVTCDESPSMAGAREDSPERMKRYCAYRNTYTCESKNWKSDLLER